MRRGLALPGLREERNGQGRPFFHVLCVGRGGRGGGNSVNATLVFRAFARARTWRANEAKGRRRFGGKLEEALVSLGGQRRRAVINLGRYSCTRANENRGRDRDEF